VGTIHVIETIASGLHTATVYLSEINADYAIFGSVDACLKEAPADLVILLADKDIGNYAKDIEKLKSSRSHGRAKRLCVLPFDVSIKRTKKQIIDGEIEHPMPLDREKFLFSVGQCLNIPQRRAFQTIVTIQPEAAGLRYSGKSVDFSESGMSFECDADLPLNQFITVSFGNPAGGRLRLGAMVARKNTSQSGAQFFHGVRFVNTTDEEKDQLRTFLSR
jgi:hypothetical protein